MADRQCYGIVLVLILHHQYIVTTDRACSHSTGGNTEYEGSSTEVRVSRNFFTEMKNKTKQSTKTFSQLGKFSKATVEIYSGIPYIICIPYALTNVVG